jgi:uncharacterized protein YndB with AHSA1/START domain
LNIDLKKQDLIITRVFDAPVQEVWNAWSDAEYVKQWWGPHGFTCPLAQIDFREGGTSLVCMSSPQFGEHYSTWHYREIVPLERIDFISNLTDKNGQVIDPASVGMPPDFQQDLRTTVVFQPLGQTKTEITITEYGWPVGQMREMSKLGMEQCLEKMAATFAG